jgi:hypothetical protein
MWRSQFVYISDITSFKKPTEERNTADSTRRPAATSGKKVLGSLSVHKNAFSAGAFKSCHSARISVLDPSQAGLLAILSLPQGTEVVAKRPFYVENGKKKRYDESSELTMLAGEAECHIRGMQLLEGTMAFVKRYREQHPLSTAASMRIPNLRFVRAGIASTMTTPSTRWILEEKVPGDFHKYIGNRDGDPLADGLVGEELDTARFLCFTQHVQYLATSAEMIITDFQGMRQPETLNAQNN